MAKEPEAAGVVVRKHRQDTLSGPRRFSSPVYSTMNSFTMFIGLQERGFDILLQTVRTPSSSLSNPSWSKCS